MSSAVRTSMEIIPPWYTILQLMVHGSTYVNFNSAARAFQKFNFAHRVVSSIHTTHKMFNTVTTADSFSSLNSTISHNILLNNAVIYHVNNTVQFTNNYDRPGTPSA